MVKSGPLYLARATSGLTTLSLQHAHTCVRDFSLPTTTIIFLSPLPMVISSQHFSRGESGFNYVSTPIVRPYVPSWLRTPTTVFFSFAHFFDLCQRLFSRSVHNWYAMLDLGNTDDDFVRRAYLFLYLSSLLPHILRMREHS